MRIYYKMERNLFGDTILLLGRIFVGVGAAINFYNSYIVQILILIWAFYPLLKDLVRIWKYKVKK